jgi:putative holliday junction resolvase
MDTPMRIMCLDVGDKKIGISLSDPTRSIAQALKLYRRGSLKEDIKEFASLVKEHDVEEMVVGLPKNLNGSLGQRAKDIMEFARKIEEHLHIPVSLWDERFSTNEAHRVFELAQVSHKKRKPFIDMMASQLILQGYLDARVSK